MKLGMKLISVLWFAACATVPTGEATGGAGTGGQGPVDDSIVLSRNCPSSNDHYELVSADVLTDGRLAVEVAYSGGCEEHSFSACWSGAIYKSFPPQADIKIYHNSNGDQCEAWLEEEIYIDTSGEFDLLSVTGLQSDGVRVAVELP